MLGHDSLCIGFVVFCRLCFLLVVDRAVRRSGVCVLSAGDLQRADRCGLGGGEGAAGVFALQDHRLGCVWAEESDTELARGVGADCIGARC